MKHYGIIGYPLQHSFSAQFFNKKFADEGIEAEYSLYPLDNIRDFPTLISTRRFSGMNVTMPYKQSVIPYIDSLDEGAQSVGAVNVIAFGADGALRGYNTDVIGFRESICALLRHDDRRALILGTGGAAKAAACGLHQLGIESEYVSRDNSRGITYDCLTRDIVEKHSLIVNCTPLGMHPETENKPDFPYNYLTSAHFLFDCIYNPEKTLFLLEGERRGCRTMNGTGMLYGQAKAAWRIWNKQ